MKNLMAIAIGIGCACFMVSCGGAKTSADSLAYVTPSEGLAMVQSKGGVFSIGDRVGLWLDPRTASEYAKGHIPDAMHLPYQSLATLHRQVIGDADLVVVYGDGYNDAKAEGMSKRLIELGYKKVHTLQGGLRAWTDAGLDVETGDS